MRFIGKQTGCRRFQVPVSHHLPPFPDDTIVEKLRLFTKVGHLFSIFTGQIRRFPHSTIVGFLAWKETSLTAQLPPVALREFRCIFFRIVRRCSVRRSTSSGAVWNLSLSWPTPEQRQTPFTFVLPWFGSIIFRMVRRCSIRRLPSNRTGGQQPLPILWVALCWGRWWWAERCPRSGITLHSWAVRPVSQTA